MVSGGASRSSRLADVSRRSARPSAARAAPSRSGAAPAAPCPADPAAGSPAPGRAPAKRARSAGRQRREVEHGRVAPDRDVLLSRLRLGREQELGRDDRTLAVGGVERDRHEMRVGDGAVGEDEAAHRVGQPAGQDQARRLGRVERHREVDLAVVEQLVQRLARWRGRPGRRATDAGCTRSSRSQTPAVSASNSSPVTGCCSRVGVGHGGVEHVLEEGRADEVGRGGVGEPARDGLGPGEQRVERGRRLGHARACRGTARTSPFPTGSRARRSGW